MQYTSRFTNSAGGVKELYYSNGGMIDMDKQCVVTRGRADREVRRRDAHETEPAVELSRWSSMRRRLRRRPILEPIPQTSANMRNWMECVRSRKTPNAPIEAGYSHSIALCMNVAAIQTGQKVTFDDATQQVMVGGKPYA